MSLFLLPLAMAFLHRLRGGGFVTMPVKGTYVLWPFVGLLAWLAGVSWPVAVAWAVGYFVWIIRAWMVFIDAETGAAVSEDQVLGTGVDVKAIWAISGGNPFVACVIRAMIYLLPLAIFLAVFCGGWVVAPLGIIVLVFPLAYLFGFAMSPFNMAAWAEPIVGASWGLAMALSLRM